MNPTKAISFVALMVVTLVSCNKTKQEDTTTQGTETTIDVAKAGVVDVVAIDGKFCFLSATNRDTTKVSLNIVGNNVTGTMVWNPYQKDGAVGTLSGTKNANGEMDLVYNYTIEGSQQTETKVMKIQNDELFIKKGQLIDPKNDGNLMYKDVAKAMFSEKMTKSKCD